MESKHNRTMELQDRIIPHGNNSLKTQVTLVEEQGVEVDRIKKKKKKTGKKEAEQEEKGSEDVIEEREGCKLSAVSRVR